MRRITQDFYLHGNAVRRAGGSLRDWTEGSDSHLEEEIKQKENKSEFLLLQLIHLTIKGTKRKKKSAIV